MPRHKHTRARAHTQAHARQCTQASAHASERTQSHAKAYASKRKQQRTQQCAQKHTHASALPTFDPTLSLTSQRETKTKPKTPSNLQSRRKNLGTHSLLPLRHCREQRCKAIQASGVANPLLFRAWGGLRRFEEVLGQYKPFAPSSAAGAVNGFKVWGTTIHSTGFGELQRSEVGSSQDCSPVRGTALV